MPDIDAKGETNNSATIAHAHNTCNQQKKSTNTK